MKIEKIKDLAFEHNKKEKELFSLHDLFEKLSEYEEYEYTISLGVSKVYKETGVKTPYKESTVTVESEIWDKVLSIVDNSIEKEIKEIEDEFTKEKLNDEEK